MAAAIIALGGVLFGVTAWLLALLNIREKLWPKPQAAHPLDGRLADIAAAIRERGPDLHVQLRDVPPAAEGQR